MLNEKPIDIPSLTTEEAHDLLVSRGITPTQQRIEIASVLLAKPQHVSAEQLLSLVNQGGGTVSKATIYNTLGLLARSGLVREVVVDPSKVFYDSNITDHHHFYNITTGELSDIHEDQVSVGALPTLPADTVVDGVDVIVRVRSRSSFH